MRHTRLLAFSVLAGLAACAGDDPEQVIGPPPAVGCCWGRVPDQLMPPKERLLRISRKGQTGSTLAGRITLQV